MPYGLACVPAVFQCFINDVLRNFLGKFVIVYVDDIHATHTTVLKGGSKKLKWNEHATNAFEWLKAAFTSAPFSNILTPKAHLWLRYSICIQNKNGSHFIPRSQRKINTPSCCFLITQALVCLKKWWYRQQRTAHREARSRWMASLVRGGQTSIPHAHRSQEPRVSKNSQETGSLSDQVGAFLHTV